MAAAPRTAPSSRLLTPRQWLVRRRVWRTQNAETTSPSTTGVPATGDTDGSQTSDTPSVFSSSSFEDEYEGCEGEELTSADIDGRKGEPLQVPSLFLGFDNEEDPYANWMRAMHVRFLAKAKAQEFLSVEDSRSVCDSKFNVHTVTDLQIFGTLSILATNSPGPFCTLCDRILNEIEDYLLRPHLAMPVGFSFPREWQEEEAALLRLFMAMQPSVKGLCSMVVPSCYNNYTAKAGNMTEASRCLECSVCMMVTNYVQARNPQADPRSTDSSSTRPPWRDFSSSCAATSSTAFASTSANGVTSTLGTLVTAATSASFPPTRPMIL